MEGKVIQITEAVIQEKTLSCRHATSPAIKEKPLSYRYTTSSENKGIEPEPDRQAATEPQDEDDEALRHAVNTECKPYDGISEDIVSELMKAGLNVDLTHEEVRQQGLRFFFFEELSHVVKPVPEDHEVITFSEEGQVTSRRVVTELARDDALLYW